jgi:adenine-specific DNA-methyltransferase
MQKEKNYFEIHNRKYIGAKYRLLDFLSGVILKRLKKIGVFIDGFAGTGVVGHHFNRYADKVISNDNLYSNYVVNKAFLDTNKDNACLEKLKAVIYKLNKKPGIRGYVYNHFSGTYFTHENAALIDDVREEIERITNCTLQEKYILLTSLLYAMDKAANTVGQYDAFLKHIDRSGSSESFNTGKHLIDSNVQKRLTLLMPKIEFNHSNEIYNEDINDLISRIKGDILYIDPPYNNRQYIDCYHVLENIIRWEKPDVFGKTKKFKRDNLKSRYSKKHQAYIALKDLLHKAQTRYIVISYNNEGIIPDEAIYTLLQSKGTLEVIEQEYPVFGHGAGRSVKRPVLEKLYFCKVKQYEV